MCHHTHLTLSEREDIMIMRREGRKITEIAEAIEALEKKFDGQGRVLIPKELVDYARLEKDIVISGSGDRLEIWNAQIYDEIVGKKSFDQVLSDVRN